MEKAIGNRTAMMRNRRPVSNVPSEDLAFEAYARRQDFFDRVLDRRYDIDKECGYPIMISIDMYRAMYEREGIATRVVDVFPDESWAMPPTVYEKEGIEKTEFETAWDDLVVKANLFHYLHRIDCLSGVGYFGIMLLGLDDGMPLDVPAPGLDMYGQPTGDGKAKLLFIRTFDETLVRVTQWVADPMNPRYGHPEMYNVTFVDYREGFPQGTGLQIITRRVHWTRVVHVADNRKSGEIFGTPRMRPVFNRLLDIRKVLSGSGEMFWKGAFPGFSFEVNPDLVGEVEVDPEEMRKEFADYQSGMQRYLALTGVSAKSLAPQVSDPTAHIAAQIQYIAITLGTPLRVLLGTEEAKLASTQDTRTWNKRVARRQDGYLTPMLLRPFVDRLIHLGVLPTVTSYKVDWPDLNSPTDADKAEVAAIWTEALAKYVATGLDVMVPPMEFLTQILEMPEQQAVIIIKAMEAYTPDPHLAARVDAVGAGPVGSSVPTRTTPPSRTRTTKSARGGKARASEKRKTK